MSEVFENTHLNQALPKTAESPMTTMRDDNSSDSDLDESRSSLSFRSEDMSEVSRDSYSKKENMFETIRSIKSIKVINPQQSTKWIENDPKMLQISDHGTMTRDLELPVFKRSMSKRTSIIAGQTASTRAAGDKSSDDRKLWWTDSLGEVVLKVDRR